MKKLDIQVGDRITYIQIKQIISPRSFYDFKTEEVKNKVTRIVTDSNKEFKEVLKIERIGTNGWYTVYEKETEKKEKKEKEYLNNLIKPFKNEVKYITKNAFNDNSYFINISCYSITNNFCLPNFKKDKMYKNMELEKRYTLKELGME